MKFSDREDARLLHNDSSTLEWLSDQRVVGKFQQIIWLLRIKKSKKSERWVARKLQNDELISIIRLDQIDFKNRSLLIGLDVNPKYRRQKFATEIYSAIIPYLFDKYQMNRLSLVTLESNRHAIGLYKKIGFSQEGTLRQVFYRDGIFQDALAFSLLKEDKIY